MSLTEDMEELKKEVEQDKIDKDIYSKSKAEAEVKELSIIAQDPTKALQTKLNTKVAEHIDKSQEVAQKIEQTADKLVDKGLKVQENKASASVILSEDEIIEADFQKNKEEYLHHGIDHKVDKPWKRKMLMVINDIWFVIIAIISAFTIVPVSTFLSRIKALHGIVKWLAIVLGVAMLLACLGGLTYALLKRCGVI